MIVCFGSLNQDLAVRLARLPAPDETVLATDAATFRGGKGHNQALAVARLGAPVAMVGSVGDDDAGRWLRDGLASAGVDVAHVRRVEGQRTGTALCLLDSTGQVAIVVVPGANAALDAVAADAAAPILSSASALLLQGEVAVAASLRAASLARDGGATVVVNPAPVPEGVAPLLDLADVVVVNRPEAAALGLEPSGRVVMTLGAEGVAVAGESIPAFPARTVDPTAAGDSFVAALAVALHEGADLVEAARFGAAAGACTVEVAGAEPSLPTRAAVEARLGAGGGAR
ncbi:MAG: ribokinase [Acidimicrobiales bacterium]